jgi:hypothetical protein
MNENYPIDRKTVLNFLHCKEEDANTKELIDSCISLIEKSAKPRYVFRRFKIEETNSSEIKISNTNVFLTGSDILRHLENCTDAVFLAATIGSDADSLIRTSQVTDIAKAVVLDCCASAMIESVCCFAEGELRKAATQKGEFLTSRFSPGYGNLPLSLQKDFLAVLDAQRKIGLSATADNLLVPNKSVTAVLGLSDRPVFGALAGCKTCALKGKCEFRKNGTTCFE